MERRGLTPIIASHNLRELEDICDHVGLLHHGGVLLSRELEDMKCNIQKVQCVFSSEEEADKLLSVLDIVKKEKRGSLHTLTVRGGRDEILAQFAAAEYTALVGQLALLREFGFACEEFGDGAILIRALPTDIPAEDAAASLEDLAGRLVETHHADPESARDALLHTMACKAAIKGGWKSDERELRVLVDKVQSGEVRFCPHGRPVTVKLTKYELEKMFKRA